MPIITSIALTFAAITTYSGSGISTQAKPVPVLTPAMVLSAYDSPALDAWIEKLVSQESGGKKNIKVLDHNGYYSYGCLQFQKATFIAYGAHYGFFDETDNINELIYDCDLQKTLAKLMILDNYKNWRHWYTSSMIKKVGRPPKSETSESPHNDRATIVLSTAG